MSKTPKNPYADHSVLGKRPSKPLTLQEAWDIMVALCEVHDIPEPEKDPDAGWKLAICLAMDFVPALQPRKSAGRPQTHSVHDIVWVLAEFGRVGNETGLPSIAAIIKKMADDQIWQDQGFGKSREEVLQALRYILTDRINQPEIKSTVVKDIRETIARLEELFPELTKKSHPH